MRNQKQMLSFLNLCLNQPDPRVFRSAVRYVIEANGGLSRVARKAGMKQKALERMLSWNGSLPLRDVFAILRALGVSATIRVA
jgi:probable addiction module antidote protein